MGNFKIMKYIGEVSFFGMADIFILCFMYLYICA